MKFTANAKTLAQAITLVSRTVATRTTYPILSNVKLEAADDSIRLTATDLDIEITTVVKAEIAEPGETTLPAKMTGDFIRKLAGDVEFELGKDAAQVTLKSGRSRMQVSALSSDGFPTINVSEFIGSFAIPGAELSRLLSTVQFAISNEEVRYYLNGIYLVSDEGSLRAVATDGHKLARIDIEAPAGAESVPGIIIPKKTVAELIKIGEGADVDDVTFEYSENKLRVTSGDTVLVSKIIEGTFPDYERVTPEPSNMAAIVDVPTTMKAVDRVMTLATDRGGKAVKFSLSDNLLRLEVINPDHGKAEDEVAVDYDADDIEIGFNASYVKDCFGAFATDKVRMQLTESGAPTLLTSESAPGIQVVLMPMRV